MSAGVKKWAILAIRWTIAVAGIWYVLVNISWRDQVLVLDPDNRPHEVRLAEPWDERSSTVTILDPVPGLDTNVIPVRTLVHEADREQVTLRLPQGPQVRPLLAVDLATPHLRTAERVLVEDPETGKGIWFDAAQVVGGYQVRVPFPLVQSGLGHMLQTADPVFLWAAVLIFPLTFLITGLRWHLLLKALDIHLGLARAFIINMVGAFYNTFMPGSTGGDVLKAYYAAKQTHLRTRAVMSVIVDRAIGLIALITLGGTMAALQWQEPATRQIAVIAAGVIGMLAVGMFVFYTTWLRHATGLGFVLRRLPMQTQVNKAIETMEIYRRRPWLVTGALVGSLPVHMTVVVSAMFAGMAFDLPLRPQQYWVIVPVIVLAGSIPISPQGAGVMEFFAILLTRPHGCTVAQAFALTMSIRLVQIAWNLTGGIFVLRGGYHAPTAKEQAEQEEQDVENTKSQAPDSRQMPVEKEEKGAGEPSAFSSL
ncbi:MAG TPA: lysylphosphatidylglycerol synthase transmembrane domain-containing protein [Tepidisphaeraceae bacterium]|nr:lysylphosphatidylglycerol synthase transmembrane domain-containing protein [Tepidisphaeraceae bacterium]